MPLDNGRVHLNKLADVAPVASRLPALFDGWWIHNGKDERVHARHQKSTRSNLLFLDNSARTEDTFRIPSVDDAQGNERLQFRLPKS